MTTQQTARYTPGCTCAASVSGVVPESTVIGAIEFCALHRLAPRMEEALRDALPILEAYVRVGHVMRNPDTESLNLGEAAVNYARSILAELDAT